MENLSEDGIEEGKILPSEEAYHTVTLKRPERKILLENDSKPVAPIPIPSEDFSLKESISSTQSFDVHSYIFIKNNTTLEQACSKRAISFYGLIKEESLKTELTNDFTEMELAYFRNDYLEFGRRIHKQIEAIVNYSLFDGVGLSKLQADILTETGTDSKKNTKKIGEIVLPAKRFSELPSLPVTRQDMTRSSRENLFCYYFINTRGEVQNFDYRINGRIDVSRIKASHGQATFDANQQRDFDDVIRNTTKFYFESMYLLQKFRFSKAQKYLG